MQKPSLDWSSLDWKKFQQLTLHVAENELRHLRFEEYLKQGSKQDGIDITSTTNNKRYTAIQCKRSQLNIKQLDELVAEFKAGEYYNKTSHFILSTTSDLQSAPIKKHLNTITEELRLGNIQFEVWDIWFLEEHLKKCYSLVSLFFTPDTADKHCLPQKRFDTFEDFSSNYIPRKIYAFDEIKSDIYWKWSIESKDLITLTEHFKINRLQSKRICLIGDPYQGKSFLLKQTAYELTKIEMPYAPLWIEVKHQNIEAIEIILSRKYGTWKATPINDIVVIIDGLDEAPTDKFNEAVNHINSFLQQFPAINIIFSCRKLFFNHYTIKGKLSEFTTYDLYPLGHNEVHTYLKYTLTTSYNDFIKKFEKLKMGDILYEPFFLNELISSYSETFALPTSRADVLNNFIDRTISKSELRRLANGKDFKHNIKDYRICIQKLAFSLQLLGLNSLSENDAQTLFSDKEKELLQHSSLVTIQNSKWSFTSALFQEFLSAQVLTSLGIDSVKRLVTVGEKLKKVKTKWLQTYCTFISFCDMQTEQFKEYISLLENDNIELIFQTERSKYTSAFRTAVLKKFIDKCVSINKRPVIVYEETIGTFIGNDKNCINLLLETVSKPLYSNVIKIVCCFILENTLLNKDAVSTLKKILVDEINITKDADYGGVCVRLLTKLDYYDHNSLKNFVHRDDLNQNYNYRKELYKLISKNGEVDIFYDFGLSGLEYLIEYNRNIHHTGSENPFLSFLSKTKHADNFKKLLRLISTDQWQKHFRHKDSSINIFFKEVVDNGVEVYNQDPTIVISVMQLISELQRRDLDERKHDIENFLTLTDTHNFAVRWFYKEILQRSWEYGRFLAPEAFDYIIYEFEEGNYTLKALKSCAFALEDANKIDTAKQLYGIIESYKGLEDENPIDYIAKLRDFEKLQKDNDFKFIQSAKSFKRAIKAFFQAFGRKTLNSDDLYINSDSEEHLKKVSSNLLYSFFTWIKSSTRVSLKKCIDIIDDAEKFEFFRATELLNFSFNDSKRDNWLKDILREYFEKEVIIAEFENCWWHRANGWQFRRKEVLLGNIFLKYRFKADFSLLKKMIWLDLHGLRDLNDKEDEGRRTMIHVLLEESSKDEKFELKQEVISNIQMDIKHPQVWESHISLSDYFHISEATETILEKIYSGEIDEWHVPKLIKIFIKLGGDIDEIIPYYEKISSFGQKDYHFLELSQILKATHVGVVISKLKECMQSSDAADENKTQAALRLANLGVIDGFSYLIERIRKTGKSPIYIQGGYSVKALETQAAIIEMNGVSHFIIDETGDGSRFQDSAKNILLEWIFDFAKKSENDMFLILEFLESARQKHITHPNSDDFFWYIERCKENFREINVTTIDINMVKAQLDEIF